MKENEGELLKDIEENFMIGLVEEIRNTMKEKQLNADSLLFCLGQELIEKLSKST